MGSCCFYYVISDEIESDIRRLGIDLTAGCINPFSSSDLFYADLAIDGSSRSKTIVLNYESATAGPYTTAAQK